MASSFAAEDAIAESFRARKKSINDLAVDNLEAFIDFCDSRMAGENVRFYRAVLAFEDMHARGCPTEEIVKTAETIVVRFFSEKSPSQIGFDPSTYAQVMKHYVKSDWPVDSFRAARIEIVTMLTDSLVLASYRDRRASTLSNNKTANTSLSTLTL